jgi:hypothetical protein
MPQLTNLLAAIIASDFAQNEESAELSQAQYEGLAASAATHGIPVAPEGFRLRVPGQGSFYCYPLARLSLGAGAGKRRGVETITYRMERD